MRTQLDMRLPIGYHGDHLHFQCDELNLRATISRDIPDDHSFSPEQLLRKAREYRFGLSSSQLRELAAKFVMAADLMDEPWVRRQT
jgi:hypothetical protein